MLASIPARLALLAVISLQAALQLQAAPFPGIENAAFTSQDLLAEASSPVSRLSPVHVQEHYRHRRHHGDGNHGYGQHQHKRHWYHQLPDPGPECHHHGGGWHPRFGAPPHRFEPYPNGFEHSPHSFGPQWEGERQRPFEAELAPFEDDKERSPSTPQQPSSSSAAPPPASPATPPPLTTASTSSTAEPTSTSTEDAPLDIDIRIGLT